MNLLEAKRQGYQLVVEVAGSDDTHLLTSNVESTLCGLPTNDDDVTAYSLAKTFTCRGCANHSGRQVIYPN